MIKAIPINPMYSVTNGQEYDITKIENETITSSLMMIMKQLRVKKQEYG